MERKELNQTEASHQLVLHQRGLLDLDGVTKVEHFDELTVVVRTVMGELTVTGQRLHVRQLNLECGALSIEGQIDSLSYRDFKKRGALGRLLR